VVFAAFSIEAKIKGTPPLTTAQAFTSLSILALLTTPAMQLLQSLPQVAAASGCILRVQNFLLAKGFEDQRKSASEKWHSDSSHEKDEDFPEEKTGATRSSSESSDDFLSVTDLVVAPSADSKQAENPVSFLVRKGTATVLIGPVGSGKSTLLKAILGELNPTSGRIDISTHFVGYCAQSPWLQNRTIRENIIGAGEFDRAWYRSIVRTCALEEDLSQMPQKDMTLIGSRGITLSGGQKHRVVSRARFREGCMLTSGQALARALYSRCSVLVLDDFLSSIDRRTQRIIVHNLFAKDGGHVSRYGCAVLLATHISWCLPQNTYDVN
jgi:ATP-binding cassette subfamily C (CFTR/MRP) protein 1